MCSPQSARQIQVLRFDALPPLAPVLIPSLQTAEQAWQSRMLELWRVDLCRHTFGWGLIQRQALKISQGWGSWRVNAAETTSANQPSRCWVLVGIYPRCWLTRDIIGEELDSPGVNFSSQQPGKEKELLQSSDLLVKSSFAQGCAVSLPRFQVLGCHLAFVLNNICPKTKDQEWVCQVWKLGSFMASAFRST